LEKAAGGNQHAYRCADLAVSYFHAFDDIIDGDTPLSSRSLVKLNNLFLRLCACQFFCENRAILMPLLILIGEDYVASNEESKHWRILRHSGNNFIRAIALITGGEELLFEVSKELRDFSVKNQIEIVKEES
jgi:hypothetical protein